MLSDSSTSLQDAREWLALNLREGAICPCCQTVAKVYRRRVHKTIARALIQMYRHGAAHEFVHTPSLPGDTHEVSQASWWNLIQEEKISRADGGRAGWWKLTPTGVAFVENKIAVPEYALIYDSRLVKLEGDSKSIEDALGKNFNYFELMTS